MTTGSDPVAGLREALGDALPPWVYVGLTVLVAVVGLARLLGVPLDPRRPLRWLRRPARREERKRTNRYQAFARHLAAQIERLNQKAEWRDDRFTELEAEVEAEGRQRLAAQLLRPWRRSRRLRREPSLAQALFRSRERLILVVGDPGAGKSVALRHVALAQARRAARAPADRARFAVYVDLKGFAPEPDQVNSDGVRAFVKESLRRVIDRDVDRFVAEEFDGLLERGRLLFLFDSFDEIPEVLGATEADAVIRRYADAIYDFLNGVHECRGVIASRTFRAPREPSWVRFKVTPLSPGRQRKLIRRADLDTRDEGVLLSELGAAPVAVQRLSENPMFLGLLCDYVRLNHAFPASSHTVFEDYVQRRLVRDADQLATRFGLTPDVLRAAAERLAFTMGSSLTTGLTPTRRQLRQLALVPGLEVPNLDRVLDALEYIKVGRGDDAASGDDRTFSFAHRRFQEYFSTCLVLSRPELADHRRLLTDGRWRETAVTVLQLQPPAAIAPLLAEAEALLDAYADDIEDRAARGERFAWPPKSLHLLGILDSGLATRNDVDTGRLREAADVLLFAGEQGRIWERKWGLDVAGAGSQDLLQQMLREAFVGRSDWLRGVAYRQVSRLRVLSAEMTATIHRTLLTLSAEGKLRRDRTAIDAQIRRMPDHRRFLEAKRLLLAIPAVDALLLTVTSLLVARRLRHVWTTAPPGFVVDDPRSTVWWWHAHGYVTAPTSDLPVTGARIYVDYLPPLDTPGLSTRLSLLVAVTLLAHLTLYLGRSAQWLGWPSGGGPAARSMRRLGTAARMLPESVFVAARTLYVVYGLFVFVYVPDVLERHTTLGVLIPYPPVVSTQYTGTHLIGLWLFGLLVFAAVWSTTALLAARGLAPVRRWNWAILPLTVLVRNWRRVTLAVSGWVAVWAVFAGLYVLWQLFVPERSSLDDAATTLWSVLFGLIGLAMVLAAALVVGRDVRSLGVVRQVRRQPERYVATTGDLMATVARLSSASHVQRVLAIAEGHRPLAESPAHQGFLEDLAGVLDRRLGFRPSARATVVTPGFPQWFAGWQAARLSRWPPNAVAELLDHVGEAVERSLAGDRSRTIDLRAVGVADGMAERRPEG